MNLLSPPARVPARRPQPRAGPAGTDRMDHDAPARRPPALASAAEPRPEQFSTPSPAGAFLLVSAAAPIRRRHRCRGCRGRAAGRPTCFARALKPAVAPSPPSVQSPLDSVVPSTTLRQTLSAGRGIYHFGQWRGTRASCVTTQILWQRQTSSSQSCGPAPVATVPSCARRSRRSWRTRERGATTA